MQIAESTERTLTTEERSELDALAKSLLETYARPGSLVGDNIATARRNEDLDTLRTFSKLLPQPKVNSHRLEIVINFFRRNGVAEVASFLTAEQVDTLVTLAIAVSHATGFAAPHLASPEHDPLMMEALRHLHRTDEIAQLITERNILNAASLRSMLEMMDEHHPAITEGVL